MQSERTDCCIVGGGPAGMMAGLLLARQGVEVIVLEKHEDFFRDFRGDTIHPATLRILHELGIAEEFLALPHQRMERVTMDTPDGPVTLADFSYVARPYNFVAFVPQWDFLQFLHEQAKRYPSFRLLTSTEATDLLEEGGRVVGVRADGPDGPLQINAALVLAADGRHSTVRAQAGLPSVQLSPPMDVLWFRVSRHAGEKISFFSKQAHSVLICIDRGEYWQLAYVIPPGGFDQVKQRGLEAFRADVAAATPPLADRLHEITDWDQVKLLSVRVDRLSRWCRPGLLCIGDAAHAMSPAGGVGINLAIQDAVAAANILGRTFARGGPTLRDLQRVQRRRQFPTRVTQTFQVKLLRDLYPRSTADTASGSEEGRQGQDPVVLRLVRRFTVLRHLTGRFIGAGVRPEHVRTAPADPPPSEGGRARE